MSTAALASMGSKARLIFRLLMLLLLAPRPGAAQAHATDRGSLGVAGTAGISTSRIESRGFESVLTVAQLMPSLQYFVARGLAVSATLDLRRIRTEMTQAQFGIDVERTTTITGLGPAVTYYFLHGPRRVLPFVMAGIRFASTSTSPEEPGFQSTLTEVEASIGVLTLLTDHVGLTSEAFYRSGTRESDTGSDTTDDTLGLRFGIAAFVF